MASERPLVDSSSIISQYYGRDVFELVRTERASDSIPTDQLQETQYLALQATIRLAYKQFANIPQLETLTAEELRAKPQLLELFIVWKDIISNQLCRDRMFQQLVIDNMQQPTSVDFAKLKVKDTWLVGIYLPGFYHAFDTWKIGVSTVRALVPSIVEDAKDKLEALVLKIERRPIHGEVA